jgi:HUS1 checkpoint protein
MRPLSDVLAFRANGKGKLQFAVRTESVALETQWTGCVNPKMGMYLLTRIYASSLRFVFDASSAANSQSLTQSQARTQSQVEIDDGDTERDPEELATVHISVRGFLKFLSAHIVGGTTIACTLYVQYSLKILKLNMNTWPGICEHHCVILYVYIGDMGDAGGVLTFYIPAVVDD